VTKVLVVEDDAPLRRTLAASLDTNGYEVVEAGTAEESVVIARYDQPDLVLLDLTLPHADGHSALRGLREFSDVPVVVLTVREGRDDKVAALDAGADDYVVKPFDDEELMARVRAALRRRPQPAYVPTRVDHGDLVIDLAHELVTRAQRPVHLTATEFRFLRLLVESDGRLLRYREVAEALGESGGPVSDATLRVYVARLRKKLGDGAGEPKLIETLHGLGYRWIAGDS
jgi:two-component system, OmpR family, KDP operon response regulator KdpE